MAKYTTIQGDTWDIISLSQYGTEYMAHELMAANPQYLDVVMFESGVVLELPDIDTDFGYTESLIAPWRI